MRRVASTLIFPISTILLHESNLSTIMALACELLDLPVPPSDECHSLLLNRIITTIRSLHLFGQQSSLHFLYLMFFNAVTRGSKLSGNVSNNCTTILLLNSPGSWASAVFNSWINTSNARKWLLIASFEALPISSVKLSGLLQTSLRRCPQVPSTSLWPYVSNELSPDTLPRWRWIVRTWPSSPSWETFFGSLRWQEHLLRALPIHGSYVQLHPELPVHEIVNYPEFFFNEVSITSTNK